MLLSAEHIGKSHGARVLLEDVSLFLERGDKLGIIGVNGGGKTTLLRILAGVDEPDSGGVTLDPNVRLEYLAQNPEFDPEKTILEQVFAGQSPQVRALAEYEAKTILTQLAVTEFDRKMGLLSGGERRRVALAAALATPCDILILDEPTNHLDSEMTAWLEGALIRFTGALVMVTHDRYFLERVVKTMGEVERGALRFYQGSYGDYLMARAERLDMAEASSRKRQSILRRELQWVMQGPTARGTKSRERLERYETLKNQEGAGVQGQLTVTALSSRLGKKTIFLNGVTKNFGKRRVVDDFSYTLLRDDRIGIVGVNGAGKSTILNLIAGKLTPDSGEIEVGETVKIGYFSQENPPMEPTMRVIEYIKGMGNAIETSEGVLSASQLLEKFLFTGDDQYTQLSRLSGGERRRLFLLSILATAPNVLLLDEPTNDLDIQTLTILEDYLDTFPGVVIAVSHDRYFLDRVVARVFAVEEGGRVVVYPGGYTQYLENRAATVKEGIKPPEKKGGKPVGEKKKRLGFKEQREFETIEGEIAGMEEALELLVAQQVEKASDYVALGKLQAEEAALAIALDEKMERWMYLTELAEG